MSSSAVDVFLLLLLIVFFGIQQRSRPELFFRFWFAGWVSVLLSFVACLAPSFSPAGSSWKDALCSILIVLAAAAFLLSFIVTRERLRRTILIGLTFAVPAWLVLGAEILASPPLWLLRVLLLVGHAAGIHAVYMLLPRDWKRQRLGIQIICVLFGAASLMVSPANVKDLLPSLIAAEMFLSAAVLYGGAYLKRSFAGFVGSLGFLAWGAFYLVRLWLQPTGHGATFYEFWNVPKYSVGFAMILQTFEHSRSDFARLAEVYRALYEDFRLMYEKHPHPMWIYEAASRRLLSANLAASSGYGFTEQEMLQMRMSDLEGPEDEEIHTTDMLVPHAAEGRRARHRRKDGSLVWVNVVDRATLFQGKEARFVIARDVTQQLDLNRELAHRAHHDGLTGLPNRVLLESRIPRRLEECCQQERKAALLTIDVDHFKEINDTYGHQIGDECLKIVARRLKSKIRQVDTIARTGGEEFVAIIGGLSSMADALKVTSSLLALFETPVRVSCGVIALTVSIGGALFPDDAIRVDELEFKSDQALYAAKRAGRNRAVFAPAGVSPSLFEQQGRVWQSLPAEPIQS